MGSQTFTSSGVFTAPAGVVNLSSVTIVGGGGGGGNNYGGGGGGGGVLVLTNVPYSGPVTVTVGAGGVGGIGTNTSPGGSGGNSAFGSDIAYGGGGGASWNGGYGATSGGSGGGGAGTSAGASGTSGQGNAGGGPGVNLEASGGGGAGGAGGSSSGRNGGNGGAANSSGYGGGGGGNGSTPGTGGTNAGSGGTANSTPGGAGTANYGGGGGGGGAALNGGSGGSGIVIITWVNPPSVIGPNLAVANDVALFADTTGGVLKDGGALGSAAFTAASAYTAANAAVGGDLTGNLPNPTVAKINGETPAAVATSGAYSDLSGKPTSLPPSGSAGGDLGGTYPNPTVAAIHETSGPTQLVIGAIADGTYLKRSGDTLVGGTGPGGGDVTGPSSAVDGNVAVFNGTTGEVIADGGTLGSAAFTESSAYTAADAPVGGDLSGTLPNPKVSAITETSGPTQLAIGEVPDGSFLQRSGDTVIGGTPSGGGNVTGPSSAVSGNVALFNGTSGEVIKDGGTLGTAAFQPSSAFDAAGAATAAIGSGNNATFGLLVAQAAVTCKAVNYSTGGSVPLQFDLGNLAYIALTEAISLSPAGSSGLVQGRFQYVIITNPTSGSLVLAVNDAWTVAGAIPTTLLPGQTIALFFQVNGTSESDVSVAAVGSSVTGPASSGSGNVALFNGTSGQVIEDGGPLGTAAFQPTTAFDAAGAATAAIDSGNNATFGLLVAQAALTCKAVSYATGGDVALGFDVGNLAYIALSESISLSPSGSSGLVQGRSQYIFITNPTSGSLSITYNSEWTVAGSIPAELLPGQSLALFFQISGTSETDVSVASISPLGSAAFQPATAFDPAGAATTAISSANNATFNLLVAEAAVTFKYVSYPTGGSVQLGFDLGNVAYIALSEDNISLSPSGSAGLYPGRTQSIVITNPLSESASIGYRDAWNVIGVIPTQLAPGQSIALFFQVNGTTDSDVTVTAFSQNTDVFNVKDYGATGIGTSDYDDTDAITRAATALTIFGRGTLYFPDGRYYISDPIQVGSGLTYDGTDGHPYNANFTVKGNGRNASVIIQSRSGADGLYVLLSGGGAQGQAYNRLELFNLGFRVTDENTAGIAIHVDYGSISTDSAEIPSGSVIHSIDIGTDAQNNSGGFTSGIVFSNPWKANIYDINGYGGNGDSVPTSGAGSGALIEIDGGVNIIIHHIYGSFWQYGIKLDPDPDGNGIQGALISDIIFVAIRYGLNIAPGKAFSSIQCVNWLIDQGNQANDGLVNVAFYVEGDSENTRGWCSFTNCNFTQLTGSEGSYGFYFNNVNNSVVTGCIAIGTGYSGWGFLDGVCTNNQFQSCNYSNGLVTVGENCANNYFNNLPDGQWNDLGSDNHHIPTMF